MKQFFLLLAFFCSFSALAQKYPDVNIPFKKFVLDNGLTVIIHEDHKLPIAAVNMYYHVGSKNEVPGKTGFAHLFEHIMFTSTEHWGNFDEVMQTVGGSNNNGTTNNDRTNYFETFTAGGLERVLWVEADRMGFLLKGLDSNKIEVQRGVVQNEKRQNDNEPYSLSDELTAKATYPVGHPYSWTVIGSLEDLQAASVEDVKNWFRTYYGPNNTVMAIAGDVNTDEALALVKKYFSDIPAGPPIAKFTKNISKMKGYISQVAEDRVPQTRIQKTWNTPEEYSKDATMLNLLSDILTRGKSSRLYKKLIVDNDLVSDISSYHYDREIGSQFYISVDAKPNADVGTINKLIDQELKNIMTNGVTVAELEKVKTNYFVGLLKGLESLGGFGGKSDLLAHSQTFGGSPDAYKKVLNFIKSATPADIKKVAQDWLSDGEYNLTIVPFKDFENTSSNLDRTKMPALAKSKSASFPEIKSFTLSNGLKVYLSERKDLPLINMAMAFDGGTAADVLYKNGVSRLTSKMMTEGTKTKTAEQISDFLNNIGSTISGYSSTDNSIMTLFSLKNNIDPTLKLFSDILMNPAFPEKEFARERQNQILQIDQDRVNASGIAGRVIPTLLFAKNSPYHRPTNGTGYSDEVKNISRNDLIAFHKNRFVPNNGVLVVTGDISESELKSKLEREFANWKPGNPTKINFEKSIVPTQPTVYIVDRPGAAQSLFYLAQLTPKTDNKAAFDMMNTIFGGSFLSRLNMNLREDKHWSYGAFARKSNLKNDDYYYISTSVQTDKTKESLEEVIKEINGLNGNKLISADELKSFRDDVLMGLPGQWQSNNQISNFILQSLLNGNGIDYPGKYAGYLENLTVNDVQKAASETMQPNRMIWLIVGDRAKIESGIRSLNIGTVKILDADGNPVN